jgi:hypothetical protein
MGMALGRVESLRRVGDYDWRMEMRVGMLVERAEIGMRGVLEGSGLGGW